MAPPRLQIFWRITVPLMWPTITVIITLTMIGVLKIFDIVFTMTAGGPAGASDVLGYAHVHRVIQERESRLRQRYRGGAAGRSIPVMAINIRRFQSEGSR